jgi:hypothetical protein
MHLTAESPRPNAFPGILPCPCGGFDHFPHVSPKKRSDNWRVVMDGRQFFLDPPTPAQRRYEAIRAVIVERQSLNQVARRFGYAYAGAAIGHRRFPAITRLIRKGVRVHGPRVTGRTDAYNNARSRRARRSVRVPGRPPLSGPGAGTGRLLRAVCWIHAMSDQPHQTSAVPGRLSRVVWSLAWPARNSHHSLVRATPT